jgi:GR25 family glycosyltransferase involved in LPS biosynthesis
MIFNTIFDNIYVLNLKESIDRKTHIENEFKRVGIEKYQFFEATRYDSEEVKNLMNSGLVKRFPNCFRCNQKRCDCENNFLTSFQIGNWCSFINIFNDIIKNNYNFVLICEDDIVFTFQHKRIINTLLSKENFKKYRINMNKPLLIRMGTAFNASNHNDTNTQPFFLRNFALCNPCFAINKEMAHTFLKNLKIIDYHSDVYFHQKIPKNVKGVQYFTMYPYPVYELSFVKSKQKFESLIRPKNQIRRKEYKEYLFLSTNILLNIFLKNLVKKMKMDIRFETIGFNGNIDNFILLDEKEKERYFFQNKILVTDDSKDDLKIIHYNIIKKNEHTIKTYNSYLNKINEIFNLDIKLTEDLSEIKIFYEYYLKLLERETPLKININDISNKFSIDGINKEILNYNLYKKLLIDASELSNDDTKVLS